MIYRTFSVSILIALSFFAFALGDFQFVGVNQAGLDFGTGIFPGVAGSTFTAPTTSSLDFFANNGMNVIRLPFLWERLQPVLYGPLDATYLALISKTVNYANSKGLYVVFDLHNYARFGDNYLGSSALPYSAFTDFWKKFATLYKSNPKVIFGLMNEPNEMPTINVLNGMNAGIQGVRAAGATQLILVPGNDWTGAHSWMDNSANLMLGIVDSGNNWIYEMHQYFDSDFSGRGTCDPNFDPQVQFGPVTNWLRQNNKKVFLGEFGIESSTQCLNVLSKTMAFLKANSDIWVGWTWWAAGPWWGSYPFSVEPSNGVSTPQFAILKKFASSAGSTASCGDNVCSSGESCSNCPSDCGTCPVQPVTPSTTGSAQPMTPSTTGSSPSSSTSCSTVGFMRCATDRTQFEKCSDQSGSLKWGSAQSCASGTVCRESGNYIYCVADAKPSTTGSAKPSTTSPPKPSTTGPSTTGPITTGQSTTGQSKPSTTGPSKPSTTGPSTTGRSSTSGFVPSPQGSKCSELGIMECVTSETFHTCSPSDNGVLRWSASQSCGVGTNCDPTGKYIYCK